MLKRLFGRREKELPRDVATPDGRLGPEPPPAPSANRPGVTVHAATAGAAVERTPARLGVSRLGPVDGTPLDPELSWAAIALVGAAQGDVVVAGPEGAIDLPKRSAALVDGVPADGGDAPCRIARDALAGTGMPGITGARVLARTEKRAVLRLGPPPGARWAVVGLRSVAVLVGKLTLIDGDEGQDVRAGEIALVADPTATLHVQAGNDAAVAIGFAAPDVLVRLG